MNSAARPTYPRIETASNVPAPGPMNNILRESRQVDFKETVSPDSPLEHAKDMVAFANWLGGVILVGAKEDAGVITYPGIARAFAAKLRDVYEKAAKDHCDPPPGVDAIIVEYQGSTLLAVNIDPHVGGLVAAQGGMKKQDHNAVALDGSWRFPVRVAGQTGYLRPSELPMYMNPAIRRVFLLLNSIPPDKRPYGKVYCKTPPESGRQWVVQTTATPMRPVDAFYTECSLIKNAAVFLTKGSTATANGMRVSVPLSDVDDVWEESDGVWVVRVRGILQPNGTSGLKYVPTYG